MMEISIKRKKTMNDQKFQKKRIWFSRICEEFVKKLKIVYETMTNFDET